MDCGPTCVRMVAKFYGRHFNGELLRNLSGFGKQGVSMLGISELAEKIGFRTRGLKATRVELQDAPLPAILHWDQNHFVVLIEYKKNVLVADPAKGIISYRLEEFLHHWVSSKNEEGKQAGIVLLLEPTPDFYVQESQKENKLNWSLIAQYLVAAKSQILQVFIALLFASAIQLVFPFFTQSIVDTGISTQNLQYIFIVLIAQTFLMISQTSVEFIRSRLLIRISNMLSIQILSDFWIKLTRLPISYFEIHHTGDTLQRINDYRIIQRFLTGQALTTMFSIFNFVVFSAILVIYDVRVFFIFCFGSVIYIVWVLVFQRVRRKLNYQTFHLSARENNATLQLIQGMQEIRLNNAEREKRWEWENIQANIFKIGIKNLNYSQLQQAGATLINSLQGIVITFIVAQLVIDGILTLGAMLAIQYVVGQMNGLMQQMIGVVQSVQDVRISLERLNEVHQLNNETEPHKIYIAQLPENKNIVIRNLSFTYPGAGEDPVLQNIELSIPENKVTAIVGASGSGKTTLIKLLLKVYDQYKGDIRIGKELNNTNEGIAFSQIDHSYWRSVCGAVLQDGYIFNDSIARNITVGKEDIDYDMLVWSCKIANIHSFIESLPNGYFTKLGAEGTGISQGQRQRILIARTVYKNPHYLFFDEATNSLDANNERDIIGNLNNFFQGKTVVVVAHRLSTVKNADKIVVLDRGKIVEEGTHAELVMLKRNYYNLLKNQLELGK